MLQTMQMHYQRVKAFYRRYESFFMPALIIWGFIYHYITFKVIPVQDVLYLVFGYLALATLTIVFMHVYDLGKIPESFRYVRLFVPLLLQFAIGSMIGNVFIFYWFSGSIFVSWLFIALIVVLLVGLEFYKHYLENPILQFALYCLSAFLLLAVALPFYFTSISPALFMAAGWLSLGLSIGLTFLLGRSPAIANRKYKIITACSVVFVAMNIFYFANLIPPVPLSIRDGGIYHDVSKSGNGYIVSAEAESFWEKLRPLPVVHLASGERAFVYTSVYSPSDLDTDIVHDWQHYDEAKKRWVSVSKVSFSLAGGRQDGYRGYSYKSNVEAGKWRVYVETPRGQVLGRLQFEVERVQQPPALVTETK